MFDMSQWIKQVSNYWWSPIPGYQYRVRHGNMVTGPGLAARQNPGAFNLFYMASGLPEPLDPSFLPVYLSKLPLFAVMQTISARHVEGIPIAEWAITHKPKEFIAWISKQYLTGLPYFANTEELAAVLQVGLANRTRKNLQPRCR